MWKSPMLICRFQKIVDIFSHAAIISIGIAIPDLSEVHMRI